MFRKLFKYYTKSDWIVIITLASLAAVAFIFFHFIGGSLTGSNQIEEDSTRLDEEFAHQQNTQKFYYAGEHKKETFPFDPNLADSTDLLRLGLSPYQVRNIYRYRAAGGVYQHKEDFAQLYGLTKGDYDRLAPYIVISEQFRPASDYVKRRTFLHQSEKNNKGASYGQQGKDSSQIQQATEVYNPKIKQGETISVNTADTTQLQRIPGIGPYYARQIIYYGKQLGGFVNKEQLLEIEGFPEDALDYIEVSGEVAKINVNKATLPQLRRHPYINFYQAKAIADYHRKNGPLKSLEDLRFLPQFKEQDLQRLAPYITF